MQIAPSRCDFGFQLKKKKGLNFNWRIWIKSVFPHLSGHPSHQTQQQQNVHCWRCWWRYIDRSLGQSGPDWDHKKPDEGLCRWETAGYPEQRGSFCAIQKDLTKKTMRKKRKWRLHYTHHLYLQLQFMEWWWNLSLTKLISLGHLQRKILNIF